MTIVDITNILTRYIEGQTIKPMVTVGSVYENFNTKELKYPIVNFNNVNTIKKENETVFGFTVYYADRLNEDESNLLEIQSQATTALQLLLKNIYDSGTMTLDEFYNAIISPFRMKFADKCAGAWMQVNIHAIGINDCGDFIPSILEITENGRYDVSMYEGVEVDIPRPSGEIDITSNGAYDVELVKKANVMVDPDGNWQSGYTSGYTDGWQSGYTSGHTSGFTEGYQSGYTDGYQSGYTDGVDSVPLTSITIYENGTYTAETGGYNEIVVDVQSGITPTGTTTILKNGTYDVTNDATAIVNITDEALIQSGYTSGYTVGRTWEQIQLMYPRGGVGDYTYYGKPSNTLIAFYLKNVYDTEISFGIKNSFNSSSDRYYIEWDGVINRTEIPTGNSIYSTYTYSNFSGWVIIRGVTNQNMGYLEVWNWGTILKYCKAIFVNTSSSVGGEEQLSFAMPWIPDDAYIEAYIGYTGIDDDPQRTRDLNGQITFMGRLDSNRLKKCYLYPFTYVGYIPWPPTE